jgi:hypothetical protein
MFGLSTGIALTMTSKKLLSSSQLEDWEQLNTIFGKKVGSLEGLLSTTANLT